MKTQRIILFLFFLFVGADLVSAAPIVPGSFSTTWEGGDSSVIQINLGVCPSAVYWEEIGNESNNGTSTVCIGSTKTISFPYAGQYRVDFSGNFNQINLIDEFNRGKFRTVEQWGDSEWSHFHQAFLDVPDLTFNAIDAPNLSSLHSMYQMFAGANSFNSPLNHWDVSNVRDMGGMFLNASSFDQPLDNWNVSQVEYANALFSGATAFNQPLNSWDVSDMIYMSEMFAGATAFNQPLNNWNISEPCPLHTGKFWNFFITPAHACIGVFFDMRNMFADSGMDTENYSLTLQGWSRLPVLPQNINLGTVPSQYCDTAQPARDVLIANGWSIIDEGATTCAVDEEEMDNNNSSGGTATRVGERSKSYFYSSATSSDPQSVTKESFIQSVRNFIDYLTKNEASLENLTPEESTQIIIGLREIVSFLLKLIPGL